MKAIMTAVASSLLVLSSISAFADKVMISGSPVVLEENEGVYVVPASYNPTTSYNYVTIGGTNSVCYADTQPTLAKLTPKTVDVMISGKKVQWTCYNYDDAYFTIAP